MCAVREERVVGLTDEARATDARQAVNRPGLIGG